MNLTPAIVLRTTLAVYLPSLLSRYSTQVLVISIPWLLQAQGVGLADISAALLPFYAGALVFSALASVWATRWPLARALVAVLVLQGLFSLLCLLSTSVAWLAAFRFLQGAATGLARPLSQLWALERQADAQATPERKMQINVFVQVAIALGMALGSLVGVLVGSEGGGLVAVSLALLLPMAAACAGVAWVARRMPAARPGDAPTAAEAEDLSTEPRPFAAGAMRHQFPPGVAGAFLVFFASMAAYNVWPILVPFAVRSRALPELLAALALVLALQPLLFGLSQLAVSALLQRSRASDSALLLLLLASHLLSLLALGAAAVTTHPVGFTILFLAGSGVAVACIYPVSALLLMRHVERVPASRRHAQQRRLVFLFGLAGDVGQLAGGGLLAWGLFPPPGLALLGVVAALALPALVMAGALRASTSH